jgi:hypothetical protein
VRQTAPNAWFCCNTSCTRISFAVLIGVVTATNTAISHITAGSATHMQLPADVIAVLLQGRLANVHEPSDVIRVIATQIRLSVATLVGDCCLLCEHHEQYDKLAHDEQVVSVVQSVCDTVVGAVVAADVLVVFVNDAGTTETVLVAALADDVSCPSVVALAAPTRNTKIILETICFALTHQVELAFQIQF